MHKVNRNGLLTVIDNGIYSLTTFVIAFLLANELSTDDFGLYIFLFSIWLFVYFLQKGAINETMYVYHQQIHSQQIVILLLGQLFFSLILGVFIFILIDYNFISIKRELSSWFALAVICLTIREFIRSYYLASFRLVHLIVMDMFYLLYQVAVIVIKIINNELAHIVVWQNAVIVILLIISGVIILNLKDIRASLASYRIKHDVDFIRETWSFSKWNILSNASIWGYSNIYKYVVLYYMGISALAAVGACQYIMNIVNPLLNGIQNYSVTYLAKSDAGTKKNYEKKMMWMIGSIVLLMASVLLLIPEYILNIVYGGKYNDYTLLLMVFAVNLVITNIGRYHTIKLLSNKQAYYLFKVYFISMPITLLILVLSTKFYEMNGLYVYLIVSSMLYAFLAVHFSSQYNQRSQ